jgi:hypothetical protein
MAAFMQFCMVRISLALSALLSAATCIDVPSETLHDLTGETFHEFVKANPQSFIEFYAPCIAYTKCRVWPLQETAA